MKTPLLPTVLPLLVAGAAFAAEPAMRDAATHEQLSHTLQVAMNHSPMKEMVPSAGGDPTLVNRPKSIVADSDFLCFGGRATLVPKRAILHIPANMANRIQFTPGNRIVSWNDFFAVNRGWVTTVEVTREQARGYKALAEEIAERVSKSSQVVVATCNGAPISMLPPKEPENVETTP